MTTTAKTMAADDEDNEVDGDGTTGVARRATGDGQLWQQRRLWRWAMDDDDDGDGATGNAVDDDGEGATGDDDDNDDDDNDDDDDDDDDDNNDWRHSIDKRI
jgi:hypothetical protein